jgi:RHS repeat-associated protein
VARTLVFTASALVPTLANKKPNATETSVPRGNLTPITSTLPYDGKDHRTGTQCDPSGNGNMTYDGLNQMTYDAENRMVTSSNATSGTVTYAYDGQGRRVQKTAGGVTTTYVYDAVGQLAAEYGSAGSSLGCTTCYLMADHLGSTRLIMDGGGAGVVRRYDYLPFGEEIPAGTNGRGEGYETAQEMTLPDVTTNKFTGKERDAETGLDYFGARYLSSAQGRFTSPDEPLLDQDAADPQTWNLYAYGRNNPLRFVDVQGNYWVEAVYSGRLFRIYREQPSLAWVGRLSWGKVLDAYPRRARGDTNQSLIPFRGSPFAYDEVVSHLEDPDCYTISEGVSLDRDVFQAFATEFKGIENVPGNGKPAFLELTKSQAQQFYDFHTAYRYGQEIQKREQKLAAEKDPKKAAKLQKEIDQRKATREYKRYGEVVRKYIPKKKRTKEEGEQ